MCRISERLGRRLLAARLAVHIAVCAALVASGCAALRETKTTHYETVQADGQHDTQTAEAEHAKAIEYLSGQKCGGCDFVKAEEHLQKALVADVTYGPAHNTLGMLYLKQRRLYLAAWEFEYANKLMPERFEPIFNLALVYESADKLDRAIEYSSMAFSMAPRNPDVLETLIRTRLRNGDPIEEVRPLMKEVLFYETRANWVCWAKEQLSRAPENPGRHPPFPPPAPGEVPPPEPLLKHRLEPPLPEDAPTQPPKVARPILPDRATSSMGPVRDGLFLEAAQSEPSTTAKSDTPANQPLLISGRRLLTDRQSDAAGSSPPETLPAAATDPSSASGPRLSNGDDSQPAKIAPQFPDRP
jgi:Tfp pilus assembly protein PilF